MNYHDRFWRALRSLRGQHVGAFAVTPSEAAEQLGGPGDFAKMFLSHEGRRAEKWTHYFEAYENEFALYRRGFLLPDGTCRPLKILEVGVQHGGSLQLWRKFFGNDASIWGVDIDDRCQAIDDEDLNIRIGSQDDPHFLRSVVEEMGGVDVVLDDGSHIARHQRESLRVLFPLLSPGGTYAVEDVHSSYWRDFGGGYRARGSFVEVAKSLIDDMHGAYHRKGDRAGIGAASWVPRMVVYDSMVFISKRARRPVSVTAMGTSSF